MQLGTKIFRLFNQWEKWDRVKWIALSCVLLHTAVVCEGSITYQGLRHSGKHLGHAQPPIEEEHVSHHPSTAMPGSSSPSKDEEQGPSWADFFSSTAEERGSALFPAGAQGPSRSQPQRHAGAAPVHSKVPYIVRCYPRLKLFINRYLRIGTSCAGFTNLPGRDDSPHDQSALLFTNSLSKAMSGRWAWHM